MFPITAVVLTKNSSETLKKTLDSLKDFKHVLILDTGSTDNSLEIAAAFTNVTIKKHPFTTFGALRNLAAEFVSTDWILTLDSDEVLSEKALKEISLLKLDPQKVYSFPRWNYFNDKFIQWCGWYPDRVLRLYNKTKAHYSSDFVHERVLFPGLEEQKLLGPLEHFSYRHIADFLDKMQKYTTLFAEQNQYKKSSSPLKALLHSVFAFFKSYILQKGVLGGWEGFIIASYNSQTTFYKYLKLWELNNRSYYD